VKCTAFAAPRKEAIKMPEEMLSFLAGCSTPGLIKPVVYDAIGVPKSGIQKIMHDARATLPTS
jgi:hypothetical protein